MLEIRGLAKQYSGLRPLRIRELTIGAGERVSLGGLDAGVGELLVNLVTGASVPEQGEVHVFGQRTADIPDGDAWLELLERFGIVSPRGVLLEGSTLLQNLAMPFTLAIDPVPADVAARVEALASECGLDPARWLGVRTGESARRRPGARASRACAGAGSGPDRDRASDGGGRAGGARAGWRPRSRAPATARQVAALILTNDDAVREGGGAAKPQARRRHRSS